MQPAHRTHADRKEYWRRTIGEWKSSGLSVRAFCVARGLAEATFFARRRELAGDGQSRRLGVRNPSFVPVRFVPEPTAEVVMPSGLVVRVPVGADRAAVALLVTALGGGPC